MTFTRTFDVSLAVIIALAMVLIVVVRGDALYLGLWYYIAVPVVILSTCMVHRPAPLFLFGVALAIAISMLAVMSVNWSATRPEGLLGLGHIFSLPGALILVLMAASVARTKQITSPFISFLLGLGSYGTGYFISQLLVCNTVIWCGPLSVSIK